MGEYAFPKAARILKRPEFIRLSKSGTKIQNRHFIFLYSRSRREYSRIGITVSRKVGDAVVRNRIKRLVRENFRRMRPMIFGAWDINIIAKQGAGRVANDVNAARVSPRLAGQVLHFEVDFFGVQTLSVTDLLGFTGYIIATFLGLWLVFSIIRSGKL